MDNDNRSVVVEAFVSSLRDLWCNSKAMITMLTQVAAESIQYAEDIFEAIKTRLVEVPIKVKLSILYLIDSIIKNVRGTYKTLFSRDMGSILREAYLQVDQESQKQILKLRRTWNGVLPQQQLKVLDVNMGRIDSSWPVDPSSSPSYGSNIATIATKPMVMAPTLSSEQAVPAVDPSILSLQQRIVEIQREMLEIQQQKCELEYVEAQMKLQEKCAPQTSNFPLSNHIQAIFEERKTNSTLIPEKVVPTKDPRLVNHQLGDASAITHSNGGNSQFKKSPPCYVPSSVTRKDVTRGTKRPSSETVEVPVCKKIKEESYNPSSVNGITRLPIPPPKQDCLKYDVKVEAGAPTPMEKKPGTSRKQPISDEIKENCPFTKNWGRAAPYQTNNGAYPKTWRTSPSESYKRTRWDVPSTTLPVKPQDHGERQKMPYDYPNGSYGIPSSHVGLQTPLKEIPSNGTNGDQTMDVHELFQKLVTKGMIINNYFQDENEKAIPSSNVVHQDSMPRRQPSVVQGQKCKHCGVQFSPNQRVQYKKHLDWHFQQKRKVNNKGRNNNNTPQEAKLSQAPLVNLKPNFADTKSLKMRQSSIIQQLYQGQQCSTCGERFPPGQSAEYRSHLDWHFRQNRKMKGNKVFRRSWYCSLSDWSKYHEDSEEKEKNYFEQQKLVKDASAKIDQEVKIPCIRSDVNILDAHCEVCQDKLEEFYDEDEEEWQLRMAIRVEGKIYHPLCYEENQMSVADSTINKNLLDVSINGDEDLLNKSILGL